MLKPADISKLKSGSGKYKGKSQVGTGLVQEQITKVLSLPSVARHFYALKFSRKPTVTADQIDHLVFKNEDANPEVNFLSVDDLYHIVPGTQNQPTISNVDQAVPLSEDNAQTWQIRAGYTPIYELRLTGTCEFSPIE